MARAMCARKCFLCICAILLRSSFASIDTADSSERPAFTSEIESQKSHPQALMSQLDRVYKTVLNAAGKIEDSTESIQNTEDDSIESESLPRTRDGKTDDLSTLYDMARDFLNTVQSATIGDIIEENNIIRMSDFGDVFEDDWESLLSYFVGFIICLAIGIIFVIIMLLACLWKLLMWCTICCRKCIRKVLCCCCEGKCCCCSKKPKKNTGFCKKTTCSFLLLTCGIMVLVPAILVFVTNDSLSHELSSEGLTSDVGHSVQQIDDFVSDTIEDIDDYIMQPLQYAVDESVLLLNIIPEDSFRRIDEAFGISALLTDLNIFSMNLLPLAGNLTVMKNATEYLNATTFDLAEKLDTSRYNINTSLENCNSTSCKLAQQLLQRLDVNATYYHLDDAGPVRNSVVVAIKGGIINATTISIDMYLDVGRQITYHTSDAIDEVVKGLEEFINVTDEGFQEFNDKWNEKDSSYTENLATLQGYLDKYVKYYTNGVFLLCTCFLLIASCYLIGLLLGVICSPPNKSSSYLCSCTSRQAANVVMVGLCVSFLLAWVLMLVTTVHFLLGGAVETMLCRHLRDYDDTMQKVEDVLMADVTYNISIKEAMDICEANETLYYAAQLESNDRNITELLDLEQYGVYDAFDQLTDITFDFSDVTFYSEEMNDLLLELDTHLRSIDYTAYEVELQNDVTQIDLNLYANLLLNISEEQNIPELKTEAEKLNNISLSHVIPMEDVREVLGVAVHWSSYYTELISAESLAMDLTEAQENLNDDGGQIVEEMIEEYVSKLIIILEDLLDKVDHSVRYDIGKCRPLYDAGDLMVTSACQYFLDPFNALWLCYGWALFFVIPGMIFGGKMESIYRELSEPSHTTATKKYKEPEPDYEMT